MTRWLVLVTNLATLMLCILFGVRAFVSNAEPARETYGPGEPIEVIGVNFAEAERTVLLVVQNQCRFCQASMPFYRELSENRPSGTRLIAVTADPVQATRAQFDEFRVSLDGVAEKNRSDTKLSSTPTIIVVDRRGIVERAWMGLLYRREEIEILDLISAPTLANK